ncbi:MAG: hypothetical protein GX456_16110 [Verrucomicrobia bacterium]|nr:hypothetical protein [Verrucomicrobiota bacterium]
MKTKTIMNTLLLVLASSVVSAVAQGTAFTYQGRLEVNGQPYTGNAEFQPTLWDAASGGTKVADNTPPQLVVAVSNGLFVLLLDFGTNFPGTDRWLQLEVRTSIGPFTTLGPRQKLTPTPYAITASNLSGTLPASQLSGVIPSANLAGTYSRAVTFNNAANSFSGSGAGLTSLNAGQLASGTVPDGRLGPNVARTNQVWLLSGNAGTTPGTYFLGTTDRQPLELRVNGLRALRLEDPGDSSSDGDTTPDGAPNVIGGSPWNYVAAGVVGATIAGGGATNYDEFAHTNRVEADFGTVSGGKGNTIQRNARYATIGGGSDNTIQPNAWHATIGGGEGNTIQTNALRATIGGGQRNTIQTYAWWATIGGGEGNTIQTKAWCATIGGGSDNTIQTNAEYATIGGGEGNTIQTYALRATIGGGYYNTIQSNAAGATIGGGYLNTIQTNAEYATIGGGEGNTIQTNAWCATIGGGGDNTIQTSARAATIGGGEGNTVGDGAKYATIPGGRYNFATNFAFAAGSRARAIHTGSFVWADSTDEDFATTGTNQFLIRATGGVGIGGPPTNALLDVKGDVRINDKDLRLRGGTDTYQGLGWYGSGKTFAGLAPDGPVLYGWAGGVLGTHRGGAKAVLRWDDGKVGIGRTPAANALEVEGNASKTTAGSWLANSDARIKTDVATVTNALATLARVRLVSFRYTDAYRAAHPEVKDRRYLNVVAQEFAQVFPEHVHRSGEKLPDGSEILQVDTHPLTVYTAAAVQELHRELEAENRALRERLARLEELVQQLQKAIGGQP